MPKRPVKKSNQGPQHQEISYEKNVQEKRLSDYKKIINSMTQEDDIIDFVGKIDAYDFILLLAGYIKKYRNESMPSDVFFIHTAMSKYIHSRASLRELEKMSLCIELRHDLRDLLGSWGRDINLRIELAESDEEDGVFLDLGEIWDHLVLMAKKNRKKTLAFLEALISLSFFFDFIGIELWLIGSFPILYLILKNW